MSKPRAAVFSTNFLEFSQTFVYDELRHHERWEAAVCCHRRLNAALFPWPDVLTLEREGWLGAIESAAYKITAQSPRVLHWVRERGFDLLHAHFGPGSVYALGPATVLDLPLVVTYHGYDVPLLASTDRLRPKYLRYWAASKWMLRRVDRFLAASDELARMLIELGAPPDRVHVWRLGVTIPERVVPRTPDGTVRMVMVGRFVEKKGFDYGLRAFARVAKKHPHARMVLVGDGETRPQLEAIVRDAGIDGRVEWKGVLPHAEVFAAIENSDVLVAPSVVGRAGNRESGLLVVKEANARGLPAIGTWHGGIPEIIDDERTGFLVPERDVDTLADRMDRLLADPELRARMGVAARAKMEREYDIVARVRVLEDHYDAAVQEHRARARGRRLG